MKRFLIPLLIILPLTASAQNNITDEIIIDQIERMMEMSEEELDFSDIIEEYWTICENKININNPDDLNQLIELHLVNVFIIEKINEYRKNFGNFMMFDELQFVEGIDEMTLNILQPLICFEKPQKKEKLRAKDLWKRGRHQTIYQIERCFNEKAGYKDKEYLGSPSKMLLRYGFTSQNKLEFGIAMEKDAGEKNMLDFVSFHFLLHDLKFVKTLAVGDYQLAFGQGVTMGSGLAFNGNGGSLLRKSKKIRASKSANETRYLRGVATTLNYKNLDLTVFYSNKKVDANVSVADSLGEPLVVTALQQTGLHRTDNELIDRHLITQQLFGGNLSYRNSHFQIGYTIHKTLLSCELNPDPRFYNTFYFRGKSLVNQGVDFYYVLHKFAFYGEAAISDNMSPAALIGTSVQPAGYIDFTVLYRYYDKKYQNFYSNAFAAGSGTRNEKGVYLSTALTFAPKWRLTATADFPQSDWIKTSAYAPSRSQNYNLQIEHQINNKALFFIQLRYNDKEKNGPGENTYMRYLIHERKMSLRFHVTYPVGNNFILKNRVEFSKNLDKSKNGTSYLIYQDVLYNPENQSFSFAFRYALFDSPNGAVYAYENDILNSFAIGSFYHKGLRIYLLGKVKLRWGVAINAKIGCTFYTDVNEIGSGLELIEGNLKTDGKLQLVWKL